MAAVALPRLLRRPRRRRARRARRGAGLPRRAPAAVRTRTLTLSLSLTLIPNQGPDRAFGVPSIRKDIEAPTLKSVADHQNYGDEAGAEVITLGGLGLGLGLG